MAALSSIMMKPAGEVITGYCRAMTFLAYF